MINKLARRLGFQQSVPVSLVDGWVFPALSKTPIELAPREGAASCQVDQFGRIQVDGSPWILDLTLAAGARWVPVAENDRVKQKLLAPGVIETTIQTPSGPVVQRVAAGVAGGQPVAIIEVENTAGVAIAVGLAARPLQLAGRGYVGEAAASTTSFDLDGGPKVHFGTAPASVVARSGADGDVLHAMPDAADGTKEASASCRSGGAQAAAAWPLPHTATLRVFVELGESVSPTASVPTVDDINRGWASHLKQGMRVEVDELDVSEHLAGAARSVLTLWPEDRDAPAAVLALSELGFGRDAGRLFTKLERSDDDELVVAALARWAQLGEQAHQLDDLERILGRLAQAAHGVAHRGGVITGAAGWLDDAFVALGGRLHQIDQPDVAERIQGFSSSTANQVVAASEGDADGDIGPIETEFLSLTKARDKRGMWPDSQMHSAAAYVRSVRSLVIHDAGSDVQLLPVFPAQWRGRTVDVFGLPIANGNVSFGLRWHGPRPALLWEAKLEPEAPIRISAPGLDPSFMSEEREGEVLLADPGWKTP